MEYDVKEGGMTTWKLIALLNSDFLELKNILYNMLQWIEQGSKYTNL